MNLSFGYLAGKSVNSCGYCKSKTDSSHALGIWAYTLTPTHYQLLLDRGWRRSGQYLYKPNIELTCCPPYTIRLNVHDYYPSKGQAKVLKKVQKYLLKGGIVSMPIKEFSDEKDISIDLVEPTTSIPTFGDMQLDTDTLTNETILQVADPQKTTDQISDSIRPAKKPILERSTGLQNLFEIIEDPSTKMLHKLKVDLEPASFTDEKFELYKTYQIAIHNDTADELTTEKFKNFLVDTPLKKDPQNPQFGTFHQNYFIDDKLIAVGVLDILPNCVSSVYFLYDPAYGKLSLGTFSALKEINTTFYLSQTYPSLKYYYLGFYIHSCSKMKYKSQYRPSQLLCPVFIF